MEALRQRRRGLRVEHLVVNADERMPLTDLIDEAKEYGVFVEFTYRGIPVHVNPNTRTSVIAEGWQMEWNRRLSEPRFRLVCADGEEVW